MNVSERLDQHAGDLGDLAKKYILVGGVQFPRWKASSLVGRYWDDINHALTVLGANSCKPSNLVRAYPPVIDVVAFRHAEID